jgi:two-component sensor histidine kinase
MTTSRSSVFLEVIETLSKGTFISEGDVDGLAKEILIQASQLLDIDRVNAWLMDVDHSCLHSLLSYDRVKNQCVIEPSLLRYDYPNYFEHISKNDIIISPDAQAERFNLELLYGYLIPLDIRSMMEVPILSGGKLKGIICFEQLRSIREWTNDEQHFALALTQMLTLALETRTKNQYRDELEKLVKEKSLLIAEINHRVKNNLAIITALIRGESMQAKDEYHRSLFENVLNKTYSLASLQDLMYQSQNYKEVLLNELIPVIAGNMNQTFGYNRFVEITYKIDDNSILEVNKAIPLALICNEILTNSFKHAFEPGRQNEMVIQIERLQNGKMLISFKDNGPGLPENYLKRGTGFELITELADQIDAEINVSPDFPGTLVKILL